MTTIAYKDGIIAYDSRATAGSRIIDNNCDKKIEKNGFKFFMSGTIVDFDLLYDCFTENKRGFDPDFEASLHAYIVDENHNLFHAAFDPTGGFFCEKMDKSKFAAIGSGLDNAYTAMDMGATAMRAVEMAMMRDPFTGGKIRSFKIDETVKKEEVGKEKYKQNE